MARERAGGRTAGHVPEALTYPQTRQAIAALGPKSPIREIKRVCEAGGLPVSTAVGGNARSATSPGRGRTRADILVDARRALGMTIPSEWYEGERVDVGDLGEEVGDAAAMRQNVTSPLTLSEAAPLMTERQVTSVAISACVLFATIALVLAVGVPVAPLCSTLMTFVMRTTGATTGMHLTMGAELNGTSVTPYSEFDWARSTDMGSIFAATTALMTMILVTAHLLSELGALRLVVVTTRRFNAMHRDVCRRLGLAPHLLRHAPRRRHQSRVRCGRVWEVRQVAASVLHPRLTVDVRLRPLLVHVLGAASISHSSTAVLLDNHTVRADPSRVEGCRRWVAGGV